MADWHVLIKTRAGNVSLLRNLTEDTARQTVERLQAPPWPEPEMTTRADGGVVCSSGYFRICHDEDIVVLEAFGPEGREIKGRTA